MKTQSRNQLDPKLLKIMDLQKNLSSPEMIRMPSLANLDPKRERDRLKRKILNLKDLLKEKVKKDTMANLAKPNLSQRIDKSSLLKRDRESNHLRVQDTRDIQEFKERNLLNQRGKNNLQIQNQS